MSNVSADLKSVPGIGDKAVELLNAAGITNTYQLIGKFMMYCSDDKAPKEVCQEFYEFLAEEVGINSYRAGVVTSIAERVNTLIPGVCDVAVLREDEPDMM